MMTFPCEIAVFSPLFPQCVAMPGSILLGPSCLGLAVCCCCCCSFGISLPPTYSCDSCCLWLEPLCACTVFLHWPQLCVFETQLLVRSEELGALVWTVLLHVIYAMRLAAPRFLVLLVFSAGALLPSLCCSQVPSCPSYSYFLSLL